MTDTDANTLARAAAPALSAICPTYATSDVGLWHSALEKGANDARNWPIALALGGCYDAAGSMNGMRLIERPDRWFGVPIQNLTDGQWMVYRASRRVVEDAIRKHE